MKIYEYESYNDYLEAQIDANVKKLHSHVWVEKSVIDLISSENGPAKSIICHGTRNAAEQLFFSKNYPEAEIIGTEISHTANQFPMTVQHDFHEEKEEWISKFDIVYSNSFDHSYNPIKSLNAWKNQLSLSGSIYVEIVIGGKSRKSDPLQFKTNIEAETLFNQTDLKVIFKKQIPLKNKANMLLYRLKKK